MTEGLLGVRDSVRLYPWGGKGEVGGGRGRGRHPQVGEEGRRGGINGNIEDNPLTTLRLL